MSDQDRTENGRKLAESLRRAVRDGRSAVRFTMPERRLAIHPPQEPRGYRGGRGG